MNGRDRGAVLGGSGNPKVAVARDFECEPILHFVRLSLFSTVPSAVEVKLKEITVDAKLVSRASVFICANYRLMKRLSRQAVDKSFQLHLIRGPQGEQSDRWMIGLTLV